MKKYLLALALFAIGCSSEEIPQAHKGRMFDKTGALAFYSGGEGFTGSILGPGQYYTGMYDELRLVDCSQKAKKEDLTALTKDGVQFKLDIYVRYSASCDNNDAIEKILNNLSPAPPEKDATHLSYITINSEQLYSTFIRPALGESVREAIGPYIANELNASRDAVFKKIKDMFLAAMKKDNPPIITVYEMTLNNMEFPQRLEEANVARAEQAILKDKAIAEREKVDAEIQTAEKKKVLAAAQGDVEAATIDKIGAALKRNPEYLQFQLQRSMPDIYANAGSKGNMVITAPSPNLIIQTPKLNPPPENKK